MQTLVYAEHRATVVETKQHSPSTAAGAENIQLQHIDDIQC